MIRQMKRADSKSAPRTIDFIGGDEGDRTPDLMNAIHALSQLSYVPEISMQTRKFFPFCKLKSYLKRLKQVKRKAKSICRFPFSVFPFFVFICL